MKYHAPTNQFTVSPAALQTASDYFLYAIRKVRESAGLDLWGYDHDNGFNSSQTSAWHAEHGILRGAEDLGIDLGSTKAGKLDVSKVT